MYEPLVEKYAYLRLQDHQDRPHSTVVKVVHTHATILTDTGLHMLIS